MMFEYTCHLPSWSSVSNWGSTSYFDMGNDMSQMHGWWKVHVWHLVSCVCVANFHCILDMCPFSFCGLFINFQFWTVCVACAVLYAFCIAAQPPAGNDIENARGAGAGSQDAQSNWDKAPKRKWERIMSGNGVEVLQHSSVKVSMLKNLRKKTRLTDPFDSTKWQRFLAKAFSPLASDMPSTRFSLVALGMPSNRGTATAGYKKGWPWLRIWRFEDLKSKLWSFDVDVDCWWVTMARLCSSMACWRQGHKTLHWQTNWNVRSDMCLKFKVNTCNSCDQWYAVKMTATWRQHEQAVNLYMSAWQVLEQKVSMSAEVRKAVQNWMLKKKWINLYMSACQLK